MKIKSKRFHSIWFEKQTTKIIDQRWLPHEVRVVDLANLDEFCNAISDMYERGAPLIGVTAAFGLANSITRDPSNEGMMEA